MMKKRILYPSLLLLLLTACKSEADKRVREYGALLQKENAGIENSERYKTFKERYELLAALSKEVNEGEGIEITEPETVDTLCFEPRDEWDLQFDQDYKDEKAGKTAAKPYAERVNLSHEVNATFVGENFYTKESLSSAFRTEENLHLLYNILDKEKYMHAIVYKGDTIHAYERFCEHLHLMERVNNSRYFLFQKDLTNISSRYEKNDNNEFSGGAYIGEVYVYDVNKKKFVHSFPVLATNSNTVEGRENSIASSVDSDFNDHINKNMEEQIQANFGLRGKVPDFHVARFLK